MSQSLSFWGSLIDLADARKENQIPYRFIVYTAVNGVRLPLWLQRPIVRSISPRFPLLPTLVATESFLFELATLSSAFSIFLRVYRLLHPVPPGRVDSPRVLTRIAVLCYTLFLTTLLCVESFRHLYVPRGSTHRLSTNSATVINLFANKSVAAIWIQNTRSAMRTAQVANFANCALEVASKFPAANGPSNFKKFGARRLAPNVIKLTFIFICAMLSRYVSKY